MILYDDSVVRMGIAHVLAALLLAYRSWTRWLPQPGVDRCCSAVRLQ
jgi:hypothetical protein